MSRRKTTAATTVALMWALLAAASPVAAQYDEKEKAPLDRIVEPERPLDAGFYGAVAFAPTLMDTQRLSAKFAGSPPFRAFTPAVDFEAHFFARGAAIFGFSGGLWETSSRGDRIDAELSGWDIQLDMGTPISEYHLGAIALLVGLGYGRNRLRMDGDFDAFNNSDADLPTGDGEAALYQEGFVYDVALRADTRDPFSSDKHPKNAALLVSGFSVGYKSMAFSTKWRRTGDQVSNIPYVAQHMLFARLHIGFGGGRYTEDVEE